MSRPGSRSGIQAVGRVHGRASARSSVRVEAPIRVLDAGRRSRYGRFRVPGPLPTHRKWPETEWRQAGARSIRTSSFSWSTHQGLVAGMKSTRRSRRTRRRRRAGPGTVDRHGRVGLTLSGRARVTKSLVPRRAPLRSPSHPWVKARTRFGGTGGVAGRDQTLVRASGSRTARAQVVPPEVGRQRDSRRLGLRRTAAGLEVLPGQSTYLHQRPQAVGQPRLPSAAGLGRDRDGVGGVRRERLAQSRPRELEGLATATRVTPREGCGRPANTNGGGDDNVVVARRVPSAAGRAGCCKREADPASRSLGVMPRPSG